MISVYACMSKLPQYLSFSLFSENNNYILGLSRCEKRWERKGDERLDLGSAQLLSEGSGKSKLFQQPRARVRGFPSAAHNC